MKLINRIAALALALALGGCATRSGPPLQEVRAFAAESVKLSAFTELTTRYRDTYQREKPYLSPAADARERETDARRRAAYEDFVSIGKSATLYLQTLGKLAGADEYDLSPQVKTLVSNIKAWPESGLDARHASAYVNLGRLIARALTSSRQEAAVQAMLRDGAAPFASLVDAMGTLLRYYDQTNDNEKKIVLGLFEVELALPDTSGARLLAALAKAHYQDKAADYALIARRFTLAEHNIAALAGAHRMLIEQIGSASGAAPQATPP